MRLALLVLALLSAASVRAQGTGPPPIQRAVLTVGGVAGGLGAAVGARRAFGEGTDGRGAVLVVVTAYPLGMALAEWGLGQAMGATAPLGEVLVDAAVGTGIGASVGMLAALGAGGVAFVVSPDEEWNLVPFVIGAGVGLVTATVISATYTSRRFRVEPTVLAVPAGDPVPGLGLRLGL